MPISKNAIELDINKSKEQNIEKVSAIIHYQFGRPAFKNTFKNSSDITLEFSKKTGKLKHIFLKGKRILTYRPTMGQFSLSLEGAKLLKLISNSPQFRVIVMNEVQEFIKQGKSVFCKHVIEIDEVLRPGNEVIVVNQKDELLAVGKLLVPSLLYSGRSLGVAVDVRKGVEK